MLTLCDSPISPCCMKVRLALAEKGLDYETRAMNLGVKENLEPEYLALNPKGVVPTLIDDGIPIIESTLINEYLDDAFPEPPLKPSDPYARVQMRLWTKFLDEELHPANGAVIWPILSLFRLRQQDPDEVRAMLAKHPDPKRVHRQLQIFDQGLSAPVVGEGIKVFARAVEKLESALADSKYLAGSTYSLADIALTPYVNEVMHFGLDDLAKDAPRLHDWFDRIRERSSFSAAITDKVPERQLASIAERGKEAFAEMSAHLA
ncbi:MAG: glutathione S-transferase family protein [Pseudomonadota bacterium]